MCAGGEMSGSTCHLRSHRCCLACGRSSPSRGSCLFAPSTPWPARCFGASSACLPVSSSPPSGAARWCVPLLRVHCTRAPRAMARSPAKFTTAPAVLPPQAFSRLSHYLAALSSLLAAPLIRVLSRKRGASAAEVAADRVAERLLSEVRLHAGFVLTCAPTRERAHRPHLVPPQFFRRRSCRVGSEPRGLPKCASACVRRPHPLGLRPSRAPSPRPVLRSRSCRPRPPTIHRYPSLARPRLPNSSPPGGRSQRAHRVHPSRRPAQLRSRRPIPFAHPPPATPTCVPPSFSPPLRCAPPRSTTSPPIAARTPHTIPRCTPCRRLPPPRAPPPPNRAPNRRRLLRRLRRRRRRRGSQREVCTRMKTYRRRCHRLPVAARAPRCSTAGSVGWAAQAGRTVPMGQAAADRMPGRETGSPAAAVRWR